MPLIHRHTGADFTLGVWQMDESMEQLRQLSEAEVWQEAERRFTAEHRRKEWLTARVLLRELLGRYEPICYISNGKPYISSPLHISISHTKNHVAVMVGKREVGIDVEQYAPRVEKVLSRFLRDDEKPTPYQDDLVWGHLLHWCAKEVMFKMLDAEGVDLREHLRVFPFQTEEAGSFEACEYKTAEARHFSVNYRLFPQFVLAWCIDT